MKICVFCSSSQKCKPAYIEMAEEVGEYISGKKFHLVYGGSNLGLMGATANSALRNKGEVTAIITERLFQEHSNPEGANSIIVKTMCERKQKMFSLGDAFIALPGGWGTLDEMSEIITLKQLGYHNKPCIFLDTDGFYDNFLKFITKTMFVENMIAEEDLDLFTVCRNMGDLAAALP
jgi:uncharacterized protein (TIGR00730 family)